MKLSQLATAVALSATLSFSASADVAQDVQTKGAKAVIAEALQQGEGLEAVIQSLSASLKDNPQLLTQIINQALTQFPQQAAQIVSSAMQGAPDQAQKIKSDALAAAEGNPTLIAVINKAADQAEKLITKGKTEKKTETVAEQSEETVLEQTPEPTPQPTPVPPPPVNVVPTPDKPISSN